MAQFDVYVNKDPHDKKIIPYLLNVQSDFLDHLESRIIVPLMDKKYVVKSIQRLNPHFDIDGHLCVMLTADLVGTSQEVLGKKVMGLQEHRDEIIAAIDLLITGF